jgi:hypothetical protein
LGVSFGGSLAAATHSTTVVSVDVSVEVLGTGTE